MREDGGSLRIETPLQAPARKVAAIPRDPSRVVLALADSSDSRRAAFGARCLFCPQSVPLVRAAVAAKRPLMRQCSRR